MDEIIKLVKTYRFTTAADQQSRLLNEIFRQVYPKMNAFVRGAIAPNNATDVVQETARAIANGMRRFQGGTGAEFWGWCYRIARNKVADQLRRQASDRLQPVSEEDFRNLVDDRGSLPPLSHGARVDLDYAMQLLAAVRPECRDLLWSHYLRGLDYGEIAAELAIAYDAARMKVTRCLELARSLVP